MERGAGRREEIGKWTGKETDEHTDKEGGGGIESVRCRDRLQQRLDSFHSLQLNLLLIGFSLAEQKNHWKNSAEKRRGKRRGKRREKRRGRRRGKRREKRKDGREE